MNRIFLDTEFTGLRQQTSLLSIGLAAEGGALFYAELTDYRREEINDWMKANVMPHLSGDLPVGGSVVANKVMFCQGDTRSVAQALRLWLQRFAGKNSVEIWADVLAWDWVLFCELFGGALSLPEQVHYIPHDLSTLLWLKGIDVNTTREELGKVEWSHPQLRLAKHHALYDALLEMSIFENIYSL